MIEVSDLHKSFGKLQVLSGVSFRAEDGQITGLLGPNGAGKTTTLRILYGVLKSDAGEVRIQTDGDAARRGRADIAVVPEKHGLYTRLSARENIAYYGRLRGMSEHEIQASIEKLNQQLDMEEIMDRRTEGFSRGQRLKVVIARALINQPRHIILDEPSIGLDVMATRALREIIKGLRDAGKCVLFSSHVMQEVSALCDRVVIMSHGRVLASNTPTGLLAATGADNLEDAFVDTLGGGEGLSY